jgi:hypothetical protein
MKAEIAKDVTIPERLSALEDYYFLLSVLKDHDWDNELTRHAPIGEYIYWSDGSNTVAATSGKGENGRPWREAREEIARLKQNLHVRLPLAKLLSLTEAERQPKIAAGQSHPDLGPALIQVIRTFLPFIGLWSRIEGGVESASWNGYEAGIAGSVKLPQRHTVATAGLLFTARPSQLRPSYRYLAAIGLAPGTAGAFSFSVHVPLTVQHMRKGRDRLVLFVLTADGRLYKAPKALRLRLNAQPPVAEAA